MPKIAAATVAEHREQVMGRLVDAAESLLRDNPGQTLTAATVSAQAGIARNSIYRYVDHVDDLRGLVLARYLPGWLAAVQRACDDASTPAERVLAWMRANLEQAAYSGHGWLMGISRGGAVSSVATTAVDDAHTGMRDTLAMAWGQLLPDTERAASAAAFTRGLLDAGFRQLDDGARPALVIQTGVRSAHALVETLSQPS